MKSIIGYALSGLGIVAIALSQEGVKKSVVVLNAIPSQAIFTVGGLLVIGGIVMLVLANKSSGGSKIKHAQEEVPIYEGEGKKRRIVGYRKN